jgi:hypothetical protein
LYHKYVPEEPEAVIVAEDPQLTVSPVAVGVIGGVHCALALKCAAIAKPVNRSKGVFM